MTRDITGSGLTRTQYLTYRSHKWWKLVVFTSWAYQEAFWSTSFVSNY